jgi:hypothetical protein
MGIGIGTGMALACCVACVLPSSSPLSILLLFGVNFRVSVGWKIALASAVLIDFYFSFLLFNSRRAVALFLIDSFFFYKRDLSAPAQGMMIMVFSGLYMAFWTTVSVEKYDLCCRWSGCFGFTRLADQDGECATFEG